MLFQNGEQSENISEHRINKLDEKRDHLKLDTIVECQRLIPAHRSVKVRGKLPSREIKVAL